MGSGGGPDERGARAQDFRLQEQRRAIGSASIGDTQRAFRRNIEAAQELEEREAQKTRIPGFTGMALDAIGQASIRRQANILRGQSTTAEPVRDDRGQVVGVMSRGLFGGRVYSGRPEFDPTRTGMQSNRDDVTPEITPEVTEEFVPDDTTLMGAAERGRGRRRTRGTRVGGAGSLEEGYGVLLRQQ